MCKNLKGKNKGRIAAHITGGVIIAIVFAFLFGVAVMYLWNWLMPSLFSLSEITYWQAVGLIVLARLLVGSHGHGGHPHHENGGSHFKLKFEKDDAAVSEE